jgi:hypothetical protein
MPQRTAKGQSSHKGRATPKGGARPTSGRYTEPIPREMRRSPRWYPWVLVAVLLCGVFAIILNYVQLLPSSPTNWYTLGGLIAILASSLGATRYR